MSLGTAIFLSSFVLALVILYGITKDRWRWRTIVKRTALTLVAIVALLGVVVGGVILWDQRPITQTRQTEYAGLRLGMAADEVMYIKGYPPNVLGDAPGGSGPFDDIPRLIATKDLEKGKRVQDYRTWIYDTSGSRLEITFDAGRNAVAIQCYSDGVYECSAILGISDGSSEQEILSKLGTPSASRIKGLNKYISYDGLGVHFVLTKEKVYLLAIAAEKYRPGDAR